MANELQYSASQDLVVEELDHIGGISEEEMTTVSYACTCTCSDDAAPAPKQVDSLDVSATTQATSDSD
jgi:hypothetical protein